MQDNKRKAAAKAAERIQNRDAVNHSRCIYLFNESRPCVGAGILTLAFLSELGICRLGGLLIFNLHCYGNVEITQTGAKQSLPGGQKNEVVVKLLQAASLCSLLWSSNMYSISRQIERTGKAAG